MNKYKAPLKVMVFGLRRFGLFFTPRIEIREDGLRFLPEDRFVPWRSVSGIRHCDHEGWRLTRLPIGSYIHLDDGKEIWISSLIQREDASWHSVLRAWFVHRTHDYDQLIREIEARIPLKDSGSPKMTTSLNQMLRLLRLPVYAFLVIVLALLLVRLLLSH